MSAMTEDFSNHPRSITEIRAEINNSAGMWTPRDVLIAVLRDLDSGAIKPDVLIVGYAGPPEEEPGAEVDGACWSTNYHHASPDPLLTAGLLARIAYRHNRNMDMD